MCAYVEHENTYSPSYKKLQLTLLPNKKENPAEKYLENWVFLGARVAIKFASILHLLFGDASSTLPLPSYCTPSLDDSLPALMLRGELRDLTSGHIIFPPNQFLVGESLSLCVVCNGIVEYLIVLVWISFFDVQEIFLIWSVYLFTHYFYDSSGNDLHLCCWPLKFCQIYLPKIILVACHYLKFMFDKM